MTRDSGQASGQLSALLLSKLGLDSSSSPAWAYIHMPRLPRTDGAASEAFFSEAVSPWLRWGGRCRVSGVTAARTSRDIRPSQPGGCRSEWWWLGVAGGTTRPPGIDCTPDDCIGRAAWTGSPLGSTLTWSWRSQARAGRALRRRRNPQWVTLTEGWPLGRVRRTTRWWSRPHQPPWNLMEATNRPPRDGPRWRSPIWIQRSTWFQSLLRNQNGPRVPQGLQWQQRKRWTWSWRCAGTRLTSPPSSLTSANTRRWSVWRILGGTRRNLTTGIRRRSMTRSLTERTPQRTCNRWRLLTGGRKIKQGVIWSGWQWQLTTPIFLSPSGLKGGRILFVKTFIWQFHELCSSCWQRPRIFVGGWGGIFGPTMTPRWIFEILPSLVAPSH